MKYRAKPIKLTFLHICAFSLAAILKLFLPFDTRFFLLLLGSKVPVIIYLCNPILLLLHWTVNNFTKLASFLSLSPSRAFEQWGRVGIVFLSFFLSFLGRRENWTGLQRASGRGERKDGREKEIKRKRRSLKTAEQRKGKKRKREMKNEEKYWNYIAEVQSTSIFWHWITYWVLLQSVTLWMTVQPFWGIKEGVKSKTG